MIIAAQMHKAAYDTALKTTGRRKKSLRALVKEKALAGEREKTYTEGVWVMNDKGAREIMIHYIYLACIINNLQIALV
jgi:hypothetical protein